jgi:hypothetical protein
MANKAAKGVFCLEGDWEDDLRSRTSVRPVLQLLERCNDPAVPFIRRDVATVTEFEHYLGKWAKRKYDRYPILYLGFHGDPGVLYVGYGEDGTVDLDRLEDILEGRCKGRVIHFGACGTLATHGNRWKRFFQRTKALAVCGYKEDVDWMLSAAFEIVLLSGFQQNTLTRAGMAAVNRRVQSQTSRLGRDLRFRMIIAP